MPDYSKGVIYTIRTFDSVYVGSTTNFTRRKHEHKSYITNENCKSYNLKLYKTIRENGEWIMKPIKKFPCETKLQLEIEEDQIRRELNADLNMNSCGTGLSKLEYDKQRYLNNRDKIKEYRKQYRTENKEKLTEYFKQYRVDNREKTKQKVTCECGCIVNRCSLPRHRKSPKHLKLMENK